MFGRTAENVGQYIGYSKLQWYITVGREEEKKKRGGGGGLTKSEEDLNSFKDRYRHKKFVPSTFQPGEVIAVEPGLYGPALRAGIRLENNYLVTASGVELLSEIPFDF